MAKFRKIFTKMYGDEKFRALSNPAPNAQTLWTFLLTGPHTTGLPGVLVTGEAGLAEATGWPVDGFRAAFAEIVAQGMVKADWDARVVYIPARSATTRRRARTWSPRGPRPPTRCPSARSSGR
jgi:hypothetical protein